MSVRTARYSEKQFVNIDKKNNSFMFIDPELLQSF